jgi:hypothetical protein
MKVADPLNFISLINYLNSISFLFSVLRRGKNKYSIVCASYEAANFFLKTLTTYLVTKCSATFFCARGNCWFNKTKQLKDCFKIVSKMILLLFRKS